MKPTRSQIKAMSATIGTALFAVVSILVIAPMNDGPVRNRVIAALFAGFSIERVTAFAHSGLVRWWASDLLGEWFYFSDYSVSSHFAHARIYVRGGDLHYKVDLYHLPEITAIANGSTIQEAKSVGHALDRAFFYDGGEVVEILYNVERLDQPSGQGVLKINLNNSKRTMSGYWVTARDDEGPRSGNMEWYRRAEFLEFLQSKTRQKVNSKPKPKPSSKPKSGAKSPGKSKR